MTQNMFTFKENFELCKMLIFVVGEGTYRMLLHHTFFSITISTVNKHRIAYANDISINKQKKTSSTNHWLIFEVTEFQVSTGQYFLCGNQYLYQYYLDLKILLIFSCAIAQTILLVNVVIVPSLCQLLQETPELGSQKRHRSIDRFEFHKRYSAQCSIWYQKRKSIATS
jgi:hypothetical protein